MHFLATATAGALTGNAIARYQQANRPIRLKNDTVPIGVGATVPPIFIEVAKWFIEASIYQPTPLRMLQTAIAGAMIAYSITPKDSATPVAEEKKTDNQKADTSKPVPTDSNNQPQTMPSQAMPSQAMPSQAIPTSPKATPTTTQNPNETNQKPQHNNNTSETTQNSPQKSLSEQAVDFFSYLFASKEPKPKKEEPSKETKPAPLSAHQKELQEYEREEQEQAERKKQQVEELERELAYMQTDAYKEEQRQEAEAKKRKEAEDEKESREASRQFTQAAREYFAKRNRRSQRHQNPNQGIAGQPPIRPMLDVQQLLTNATTLQRRAEINNTLETLKPYHKDNANTIEEIIQQILPHNTVTSEEDFDKIQSKNVRTLQNVYHPNKINNLSVPQDKQAEIAKQLDIISGFITNLRNITYHFQLRDQTE